MLSVGFSMDVHYCMGSRVGVDFFSENNGRCGKCGMLEEEKGSGCCTDQHTFYKIADSHKNVNPYFFYFLFEPAVPKFYNVLPTNDIQFRPSFLIAGIINTGSPPLYIKNCVFRI